jgi:hypothetical protein
VAVPFQHTAVEACHEAAVPAVEEEGNGKEVQRYHEVKEV